MSESYNLIYFCNIICMQIIYTAVLQVPLINTSSENTMVTVLLAQ